MTLTPDENEELRRIHVLSQFGELPETMQSRFRELRARDEHLDIPEPTLDVQLLPRQRTRENAADDNLELFAAELAAMTDLDAELHSSELYLVRDF